MIKKLNKEIEDQARSLDKIIESIEQNLHPKKVCSCGREYKMNEVIELVKKDPKFWTDIDGNLLSWQFECLSCGSSNTVKWYLLGIEPAEILKNK